MSSKYNEFSNQCIKMQNDKRILWAYPQLKEFAPEHFLDEWEGKLVVSINEYSGTKVPFYLTHEELKTIQIHIEKNVGLSNPIQHFVGNKKEASGAFVGLSYNSFMTINVDKSRKLAWSVSITTGYAKALPGKQAGSFYPQSGTFQKTASATYYLDYLSIKYFFDECVRRYEFVENIMRTRVFDAGMKGYLDKQERGTATAKASEAQASNATPQTPPQTAATSESSVTAAAPMQTRNIVPVAGLFQKKPTRRTDGKGYDTQLLVKGKLYDVVIKEATPQIVAKFKEGRVTSFVSWQEDNLLYIDLPS